VSLGYFRLSVVIIRHFRHNTHMVGARKSDVRASVSRCGTAAFALLALILGVVTAPSAAAAPSTSGSSAPTGIVQTADLSKFQAGNIISDAVFFNRSSMTEAQIQTFLLSKVKTCASGYTCLKDYYDTSRTTTADAMCGAYSGGIRERASRIIYKVAQACGINPQVILVMLQKEQGLILSTAPSSYNYRAAMGQGCPDTSACDTRYYGFFNQVFGGAWQMKRYANPAGTSQFFTWYAPGKTWNIKWHPNSACGTSAVFIQNQATANLYYYTPYRPNAAAIRAGYGTGDACSSYGNRNFYQFFTDWFGSTQIPAVAPDPCAVPDASAIAPATGEFTVTASNLNVRNAPSTSCLPIARAFKAGTTVTRIGSWNEWWRIRYESQLYWVHSGYFTAASPVVYDAGRLSGETRYATAATIALQMKPSGVGTAYVASGTSFPDALSGSALAVSEDAVMLLTSAASLPAQTASALKTLKPTRVVILGGEAVIGKAVQSQIATLMGAGVTVERVSGVNRYVTSRAVVTAGWTSAPTVYMATGRGFPDALSASAVASVEGAPVLLVDGATAVPAATMDLLRTLGTTKVVLAGGTAVLSDEIAAQLTAAGITVDRKAGFNRWDTSRLLVESVHTATMPQVYVASGRNFPDALAGSVLAGEHGAPLLITSPTCLQGPVKDLLIDRATSDLTLLGGPAALTDDVLNSVRC
jgi:putative cell wall-binding protein